MHKKFLEKPEDISLQIQIDPAHVPTTYGDKHVLERTLIQSKQEKGFQFLMHMEGEPLHHASLQAAA